MESTFEEKIAFAIKHQHIILNIELAKGIPLNYLDANGRYLLEYPDGHIEESQLLQTGLTKCQK